MRSKAKIWWSESDQKQRHDYPKAIKVKGMIIRKQSNAKIWW
jgi:hypothetical protein